MNRRQFLFLSAASAGVPAASTTASGVRTGEPTRRSTFDGSGDDFERNDWVPHVTADVTKDGTADVSVTMDGPDSPSSVELSNTPNTNVLDVLDGEEALVESGHFYEWDVTRAESVAFRVELGHHDSGASKTGVFENAVLSDIKELVQVFEWDDGPDNLPKAYRFTIEPPAGWSAVMPGEKVGENTYDVNSKVVQYGDSTLSNYFVVGEFDVHEQPAGATRIRVVQIPSTDTEYSIEALGNLLSDATPVIEDVHGRETRYPQLGIVVPDEHESGGQGNSDSFIVSEETPLVKGDGSTHVHELAHSYQWYIWCGGGTCYPEKQWYNEGAAVYLMSYALYESGRIDEDEHRAKIEGKAYGGPNRDLDDPLGVPAGKSEQNKGGAIHAMLDMDIRARTGGERDIGSFLAPISDQRTLQRRGEERMYIQDEEALAALYESTDVDYTDFYERFVHGSQFPDGFFETFSITDPTPIAFAAFEYPTVETSTRRLFVDETLTTTVEVENAGAVAGSRTLELESDDETVAATEVALEPAESTTVTFDHEFDTPGEHTVRIPPAFEQTITVEERRPEFAIEAVELSSDESLVGEAVTVTVTVTNSGRVAGEFDVAFSIDGSVDESATVEVAADSTETMTFTHGFEASGQYELGVNDEHVRTVTVEATETPTDTPAETPTETSTTTPTDESGEVSTSGFTILGGLASLGGVGYLLTRRLHDEDER